MITSQETQFVQNSWQTIASSGVDAGTVFYDRLFEVAPGVRPLFPDNLEEQKGKLINMIGAAVKLLNKPQALVPALQNLGRNHKGYKAEPAHYQVVGAVLLWTLEQALGEGWTTEVASAWTNTYQLMADTMIAAQEAVPVG